MTELDKKIEPILSEMLYVSGVGLADFNCKRADGILKIKQLIKDTCEKVIGTPLEIDTTYIPMQGDPYGRLQMASYSNATNKKLLSLYSLETIKRQYANLKKELGDK